MFLLPTLYQLEIWYNIISIPPQFCLLCFFFQNVKIIIFSIKIQAGDLVNFLLAQGSVLSRFHYVGFSLGAHVAGNAGARTTGRVPRITGIIS